jgi:hypothetical protein
VTTPSAQELACLLDRILESPLLRIPAAEDTTSPDARTAPVVGREQPPGVPAPRFSPGRTRVPQASRRHRPGLASRPAYAVTEISARRYDPADKCSKWPRPTGCSCILFRLCHHGSPLTAVSEYFRNAPMLARLRLIGDHLSS